MGFQLAWSLVLHDTDYTVWSY